ncbi:MAG: hypothetical protein ACREBQ_03760 [Nitrososphaerales archaeon]
MSDATLALQRAISDACDRSRDDSTDLVSSVQVPKGDFAVQTLEIPRNSRVLIFSKDQVRLLYVGKRNRPLFVLQDNSALLLKEKLEIYYNTNNIRDASKFMIRFPEGSRVEISPQVKISFFSQKIE